MGLFERETFCEIQKSGKTIDRIVNCSLNEETDENCGHYDY